MGYGEDLACVHPVGFGDFAAGAAPGLLRWLREAGVRDGLVAPRLPGAHAAALSARHDSAMEPGRRAGRPGAGPRDRRATA